MVTGPTTAADQPQKSNTRHFPDSVIGGWTLLFEVFIHITTLSTGSIVLLTTFMKDLFTNRAWSWLVGVAFVSFTAATCAAVVTMFFLGLMLSERKLGGKKEHVAEYMIYLTAASFFCGIIALLVFALKNLH